MPRTAQTSEEDIPQPTPAPLTNDVLLTLIATMQQQLVESQKQQAVANAALAEAIGKLNEPKAPYVDPRKEANQKVLDAQMDKIHIIKKANEEYAHSVCTHIAGSNQLSEFPDMQGRTSIVWHVFDIGNEQGICTVCGKIFKDSEPDYAVWRRKPSINKLSQSGRRTVMNPIEARILAGA